MRMESYVHYLSTLFPLFVESVERFFEDAKDLKEHQKMLNTNFFEK